MKLINTPVNSNMKLSELYPTISHYIFDKVAIKNYQIYSLDRTQIIYADTYENIYLVMLNGKKKISREEIDFCIHRLLGVERSEVKVDVTLKQAIKAAKLEFSRPIKDIVLVKQENHTREVNV